jgi:DNA repair exonuclease SbcCD nuclease subunit
MPDCQTNFPIAKDAAVRRGFDYLALGDTHSFRNVQPPGTPPVVYPGAPEPTCFDEPDAGHVAVVFISHDRRVRVHRERVATWQWTHRHIGDIGALRALREENLSRTVLRLTLDLSLPAHELAEAEAILREIEGTAATRGRAEMVQRDVKRLVLDSRGLVESLTSLPGVLQAAARRLIELEKTEQAETARAALFLLYQLTREVRR